MGKPQSERTHKAAVERDKKARGADKVSRRAQHQVRVAKQEEAAVRMAERAQRSNGAQLKLLDMRPGQAAKERARLTSR